MANKSKQHRNKNKVRMTLKQIAFSANVKVVKLLGTIRLSSSKKHPVKTINSARSKYTPSIEDKKHSLI